MNIFYDSFDRFCARIIKSWDKTGTRYNAGNVQLLRFSWRAKRYWSNRNGEKVSEVNKMKIDKNQLYLNL